MIRFVKIRQNARMWVWQLWRYAKSRGTFYVFFLPFFYFFFYLFFWPGTPKAGGPSMCNWRTTCSPRKASSPLWSTLPSRRLRISKAGQFDNSIKRRSKMTTRFFSGLSLTSVSLASLERCSRQSSCRGLFSSSLCSTTINQVIGFCTLCIWVQNIYFMLGSRLSYDHNVYITLGLKMYISTFFSSGLAAGKPDPD